MPNVNPGLPTPSYENAQPTGGVQQIFVDVDPNLPAGPSNNAGFGFLAPPQPNSTVPALVVAGINYKNPATRTTIPTAPTPVVIPVKQNPNTPSTSDGGKIIAGTRWKNPS